MFEKDITKTLNKNILLFNYKIDLEYDSLRLKNHKNLLLTARDDFKLENLENMRVIEDYIRKIKKLHYVRKIIFCDIHSKIDEIDTLDVWQYRLREALKMKKKYIEVVKIY